MTATHPAKYWPQYEWYKEFNQEKGRDEWRFIDLSELPRPEIPLPEVQHPEIQHSVIQSLRKCGQILQQCVQALLNLDEIFTYFHSKLEESALKLYITFTLIFCITNFIIFLMPTTFSINISSVSISAISDMIFLASITLGTVAVHSNTVLLDGISMSIRGPAIDRSVTLWMLIQCGGITLDYTYGTPTFFMLPIDFLLICRFGWVLVKLFEKFFKAFGDLEEHRWYRIPCLLVLPIALALNLFGRLSPAASFLVSLLGLILAASTISIVIENMLFISRSVRYFGTILTYLALCAWLVIIAIQIYGLLSLVTLDPIENQWPYLG
jgi:hypothetical protein